MNDKERKLAAYFLKLAADLYANHGCNDLNKEAIKAAGFTHKESEQFATEYRIWNDGDKDEHKWPKSFEQMMDYAVMAFLAHKIEIEFN